MNKIKDIVEAWENGFITDKEALDQVLDATLDGLKTA